MENKENKHRKRLVQYPSIEQYRNVVKNVQHSAAYVGQDEDGNAIYDSLKPKPTLTFIASEKIHGCLRYDTLVTTKEFGDIPIREIVDNKLECRVLTKNLTTHENEWNKVLNSWHSKDDTKKWFKVTLEDDTVLYMTGNHRVYLPLTNEYISCDKLEIGESLLKR